MIPSVDLTVYLVNRRSGSIMCKVIGCRVTKRYVINWVLL